MYIISNQLPNHQKLEIGGMDDTTTLLWVVPLSCAMLGYMAMGMIVPERDDGVWMQPLGSRNWVSPPVRLTGLLVLHLMFIVSGVDALDRYSRSDLRNDGIWVAWVLPVFNALFYLIIGRMGLKSSLEYMRKPDRGASRKRLLAESLFLGTYFMILVLGICFGALRISQVLGEESSAPNTHQVCQHTTERADGMAEIQKERDRHRQWAIAMCPKQQCASEEWYDYCSEFFLPEGAPPLVCSNN